MKELLYKLTEPMGVSGDENPIASLLYDLVPEGYVVAEDHLGNVCYLPTESDMKTIFTAHMDEIGLMVTGYTSDHKLKFTTVGGFDPRTLPNTQVRLRSGELGVIGLPAPHLVKDRSSVIEIENLEIDIAAASREEAEEVAPIGSTMVIISQAFDVVDTFFSRNTDNRAGCAVMIDIARKLKGKHGAMFIFTVREEVGLVGMRSILHNTMDGKDDLSVVNLDVTTAGELGTGAVVSWKDGGYLADRELVRLFKLCGAKNFEVGAGGTSDHAMAALKWPAVGLAFPSAYIHSSVSKVDIRDLKNASDLCVKFCKRYGF